MFGPSRYLGGACFLVLLSVFAVGLRVVAGGDPPAVRAAGNGDEKLELAAAGQVDDTPDRPRRKPQPTPEEAREKREAAQQKALEDLQNLQKKLNGAKSSSPVGGAASQGGAAGEKGKTAPGPGEVTKGSGGSTASGSTKLGEGIYRLARNANETWTVPMIPIQQGKGIRGPSEYPPDEYVLRHATQSYALRLMESNGTCDFEIALPLPLDVGEYRRLETTVWLRSENLKITESEVRTVQQDYNTFLFFRVKTEGNGQGDKSLYFVRGSWMMAPAFFAKPKTYIASTVNPWAVELQAEAARRARIDIAAAQSAGMSPDDKQFQQCGRCAIDLRNVSDKQLLVVAGHYFSDEQTGPRTLVEGLHAWNMSLAGNIIVDGTGGNYVGPQGCNFFPTRIFPDCETINDPFSLNVGGGTVLKTKMNTASLGGIRGNFRTASSAMKVFFEAPEGWGHDWSLTADQRRQKIDQITKLFQKELAGRQRVNATR